MHVYVGEIVGEEGRRGEGVGWDGKRVIANPYLSFLRKKSFETLFSALMIKNKEGCSYGVNSNHAV